MKWRSRTERGKFGLILNPSGSQGDLRLGGPIGRRLQSSEVRDSGLDGRFHLSIDLASIPTPTALVSASAGETWWFQPWYRDVNPMPTSNFTSGISVTFQ